MPAIPKVGMRILKSSIAVFLCFAIYFLRGQSGAPFYSAIAAILCMQPYVSNSVKVALNRTVGTFIGGIFGMLALIIELNYLPEGYPVFRYLMISLAVIPLIYTAVLVKKPTAAYITCVVFMSITVSHASDINPYLFAINRIIDTLIGIFVSLGVNAIHLPRPKNRRTLFVSDLDGTLLTSSGTISSTSAIKLNQLISRGALVTVATKRTPATFLPLIKEVDFQLPVITMNGAALYDMKAQSYLYCKTIPQESLDRVQAVFDRHGLNTFVHAVIHDVLHIYYGNFTNIAEKELYYSRRGLQGKQYVYSRLPEGHEALYLMAVDTDEMIEKLRREIGQFQEEAGVYTLCSPDKQHKGYRILEVYSAAASKKIAIEELKKRIEANTVAAFGDGYNDIPMMEIADYGFAVANADERLKEISPHIIGSNDSDAVVKEIGRMFYHNTVSIK